MKKVEKIDTHSPRWMAVEADFFHTLKVELVHHRDYGTREEARKDIIEYIEMFYNRQKLHSSLGYTTPAEHERMPLTRTA